MNATKSLGNTSRFDRHIDFSSMLDVGTKITIREWYFKMYRSGSNDPVEIVGYAAGCLGRNYRVKLASGATELVNEFDAVEVCS